MRESNKIGGLKHSNLLLMIQPANENSKMVDCAMNVDMSFA